MLRRTLIAVALVPLGVAPPALSRPPTTGHPPPAGSPFTTRAVNRAAARTWAARLLSELRLPATAVRVPGEPAGAGRALASPGFALTTPESVDDTSWWTIDAPPSKVVAFLRAHRPRELRLVDHSAGGEPGRIADAFWSYAAPPGLGQLTAAVQAAPHGGPARRGGDVDRATAVLGPDRCRGSLGDVHRPGDDRRPRWSTRLAWAPLGAAHARPPRRSPAGGGDRPAAARSTRRCVLVPVRSGAAADHAALSRSRRPPARRRRRASGGLPERRPQRPRTPRSRPASLALAARRPTLTLTVRNRSDAVCTVRGFPRVALVGARGHVLARRRRRVDARARSDWRAPADGSPRAGSPASR